ncbi:MAG: alpha/beta hydrolase [Dongiaceae bacterium]
MPEVIFSGPAGRIEGRYHHSTIKGAPMALILHPHPQHGGTMNNKVVYNLFQVFAKRGFSTLRFNFRGVGRSQGQFDRGEGELADAAAALDWLQSCNTQSSICWVAGFSFGAWIAMQLLMRRPEIARFIAIAPPAGIFDFGFLAPCPSSGLIVAGGEDELIQGAAVEALVKKLTAQRGLIIDHEVVKGANHYFTDRLDELSQVVGSYIERTFHQQPAARTKAKRA